MILVLAGLGSRGKCRKKKTGICISEIAAYDRSDNIYGKLYRELEDKIEQMKILERKCLMRSMMRKESAAVRETAAGDVRTGL